MKKQDYIFLVDIRPQSKADCKKIITSIKLMSKFIFEIRYSIPKNATRN